MKLDYHPKQDYLLLQAMEEAATSKGGIIIPEAHRKEMNQGIILEIGPDVVGCFDPADKEWQAKHENTWRIGEIVIFPLHTEYRMVTDESLFYLVKATDVIAGDNGAQALSEEGVDGMRLNKFKKREVLPPPSEPTERRRPIGLDPK